jgi:chromosome segregation ATPase
VRRLAGVPQEVAHLSEELAALRQDVAQLQRSVTELGRDLLQLSQRLPGTATPAPGSGQDEELSETEQLAERMAVLEDGLDEVGQRLEGMARDAIAVHLGELQQLTRRVELLAARPTLTQEQLEETLARFGHRPAELPGSSTTS